MSAAENSQWYAVHVILMLELKSGEQTVFPVWENIHVVRAANSQEAHDRGKALGLAATEPDDTLTWNDQPAQYAYKGVRMVMQLSPETPVDQNIADETEVTYLDLEFASASDVDRFVRNEEVTATFTW